MTDAILDDFLFSLYGESTGRVSVWWRATPGSKAPYSQSKWFSWPEQAVDMSAFIQTIKDKDICVTSTLYSQDRRTPEFATTTNSIWMDSDTCSGDNYRLAPTWTVVSSPGRWQHHWALAEEITAADASEIVHRISIAHDHQGADQSSWPTNKIMRAPGTANTSHGFPTVVRATSTGEVYMLADLQEKYGDIVLPERELVRDIPQLDVADLPPYGNALAKISGRLLDMVTDEPKEGQDRSRFRYKMLLELFRANLTYEEVLTVAWNSPASRKWSQEDPRGLDGLQAEAIKARIEAGSPTAEPVDPFGDDVDDAVELVLAKPVNILTDEERAEIAPVFTWIERFNNYARRRLAHDNDQYDKLNAWVILGLAYCDTGYIPAPEGKVPLNFYGGTLGETTTGKSSSFKLMEGVLDELFANDPGYDLGGNFSEAALVKALHDRGGRVSFSHRDEAHGVLKTWATADWSTGVRETIADIYEGKVRPILRATKGESVTGSSKALFHMHLMGTNRAMLEVMDQDMFHSGFLPRFIWAIGKPRKITFDSLAYREADEETLASDFDPEARLLASHLRQNRQAIRDFHSGAAPIRLGPEAAKRLQHASYDLLKQYEGGRMWDMLQPSIIRWKVVVQKAACLLAMDDQRTTVTLQDMLKALESGEIWFTNLLRVMSQISSSDFERSCDEIERFVNSKGGRVRSNALFSKFRGVRDNFMKEYLNSLSRQSRVWSAKFGRSDVEYYVTPMYQEE